MRSSEASRSDIRQTFRLHLSWEIPDVRVSANSLPVLLLGNGCFTLLLFFTSWIGHYALFLITRTGRSMGKFQSKLGEKLYYISNSIVFERSSRVWLVWCSFSLIIWTASKRRQSPEGNNTDTGQTAPSFIMFVSSYVFSQMLYVLQVEVWLPMCWTVKGSWSTSTSTKPNWQR